MVELFINGTGCISPQLSFDKSGFLTEIKEYSTNGLHCIEPDYSAFFDSANIRRMSRVIKFAVGAAFIALRDTGVKVPGAISIGTGLGLLENSEKFLKSVIELDEAMASPTAFIQSTHNTVGGIIALMTGCHAHNNTFSQKGISFESALTDARMLMTESDIDNFLVGGFDELTDHSLDIMSRLDRLRIDPYSNLLLYSEDKKGTIAGEGAAFFVLSKEKAETSYGILVDNQIFLTTGNKIDLKKEVTSFLRRNNLSVNQVDVVITGLCGDEELDSVATDLNDNLFFDRTILGYKHLCGEYMTSSSFAFWIAAEMLKKGTVPEYTILADKSRKPRNLVIFNTYQDTHSIILLRSC